MAGRESRARLLAPSFLVIATAIACGQTQDANDIATNPPWTGTGGDGGSAGTGPVTAGTGANPPYLVPCPAAQPTDGENCAFGFGVYPGSCDYPGRPGSCGFATSPTHATCEAGTWRVVPGVAGPSCNPPMPLSCPSTIPAVDSACGADSPTVYPAPCIYATEQCAQLRLDCVAARWQIGACAPPVCPEKAPEQHSACSQDYRGTSCDYSDVDCKVTADCSAQGWEVERDCDSAQGGTGGEGGAFTEAPGGAEGI